MTFTHNNVNDTTLDRYGTCWRFTFTDSDHTVDVLDYMGPCKQLFTDINDFMERGENAEIFEQLSIPAQDALYNALWAMAQDGIE